MKWIAAGLMVAGGLFLAGLQAGPAAAGIVTFNLSDCGEAGLGPAFCPNKNAGTPILDFLSGGLDLSVEGFAGGSPNNLFLKQGTPDETGLGLAGPAVGGAGSLANEVAAGDTEVFNFGKLAALGITSGTMTVSSLQTGEAGLVGFDSTATVAVQVDSTGVSAPVPFTFSVADPTVTLTALGGDVIASADVEVQAVGVPEPGAFGLIGLGLLSLVALRFRLRPRNP